MIRKADTVTLIKEIASRQYKASQLARKYGVPVEKLRAFVEANREAIEVAAHALSVEETFKDADGLWVTSKTQRLLRYQRVLDEMLPLAHTLDPAILREIRSYLKDVADELGQLLNRGSGENNENTKTNYTVNGINIEDLR